MKTVILSCSGGIVDVVDIPPGVTVLLREYDFAEGEDESILQTDENGDKFVEIVFENNESSEN